MSTATKAPTVVQGDVVMSLIVGQGNLLQVPRFGARATGADPIPGRERDDRVPFDAA